MLFSGVVGFVLGSSDTLYIPLYINKGREVVANCPLLFYLLSTIWPLSLFLWGRDRIGTLSVFSSLFGVFGFDVPAIFFCRAFLKLSPVLYLDK